MIRKPLTTEKSYQLQEKGIWTFLVEQAATKSGIKKSLENLFGVEIDRVTTSHLFPKYRGGKGLTRIKRKNLKIARVSLKDKKKKIDLTRIKK